MGEERILELMCTGMNCAQAVTQIVGLDPRGAENPELIKAIGSMAYGMYCQFTCGALVGGMAGLALYAMDNSDLASLCKQLGGWFSERFGGDRCSDLLGDRVTPGPMCHMAMQEVVEKCFELIGDRI